MVTEVFIGNVKSAKFDYYEQENWHGYYPEVITESGYDSELFWDIIREDRQRIKQVDWGCWVLKLSKKDIIKFLSRKKYKENSTAQKLIVIANTLEENKDYLLVAFEDIISPPWD